MDKALLYFNARNNLIERFKSRHYRYKGSTDLSPLVLPMATFMDMYNQKQDIDISDLETKDGRKVYVNFANFTITDLNVTTRTDLGKFAPIFKKIVSHFGVSYSKDDEIIHDSKYKIIIVYEMDDVDIKHEIQVEKKYSHWVEFYVLNVLAINILKHVYQSEFTLLEADNPEHRAIIRRKYLEEGQRIAPDRTIGSYNLKSGTKMLLL
jgi:hypothetical protein